MIIEMIIVSIAFILFGLIMGYTDIRRIEAVRERTALELDQLYSDIDIEYSENVIKNIIKEEIEIYRVKNLEYISDLYLKDDDILKMIKVIVSRVILRMSPEVKYHARVAYNIENQEMLVDRLGDLVSLEVMAYAVETNTPH